MPEPEAKSRLRGFGGAVALVTGGASGIGAALGREMARRGALVVLADRDGADAQAEAARVASTGGRAEAASTAAAGSPSSARSHRRLATSSG